MKKLSTLCLIIALTISVAAQLPQKMSYQAVVRNTSGILQTNQTVGMRISILHNSTTGTAVYVETQTATTNANGLLTIEIGGGNIIAGSLLGIDWSNGTFFIKSEMDPTGGTNYTITGASQILSVPYAFYAKTAKTADYNELINKPLLFDGTWSSLTGKPSFATVATTGSYSDLTNRPTLFDGTWANITSKPTTIAGYGITDAISISHVSNTITSTMITNWNTSYGWGNHVGLYKLDSYVPTWDEITGKPIFAPVATSGTFADLLSKPTTLAGYGITDAMSISHVANTLTSTMITNWNTAFSWGNHAGLYRPISYVPIWTEITSKPTTVNGYGITDAVATSGDQTISGDKTFTGVTKVITPVNATDATNKAYVDALKAQILTLENNLITSGTFKLTDIDGNEYKVVKIGTQVWMEENLRTTRLNNGTDLLPLNNWDWNPTPQSAYYWDDYYEENVDSVYGKLYNHPAVRTGLLCPTGWHIPNNTEWQTLIAFLGGTDVAGGKLKETGTTHWSSPNEGATNLSGFTALPGGMVDALTWSTAFLGNVSTYGYWWSFSDPNLSLQLSTNENSAVVFSGGLGDGFSVRCIKDYPMPSVSTVEVSNIFRSAATSGGYIAIYDATITDRGICWSINPDPTISDNKTSGTNTVRFTSNLINLQPNTTYYVRAYATNINGTAYGEQISFTTQPLTLAVITTKNVTNNTTEDAISGGVILDDGGSPITNRGICWSISQNPTIEDNSTSDGTGTGTFQSSLSGLMANTTYYVKAYATNSIGTNYGNQVSFNTAETNFGIIFNQNIIYGSVSDIDGNIYKTVEIGTQVWMAENLKTTRFADGIPIPLVITNEMWNHLTETSRAYCWYDNNIANKETYGALYDWYTANTGNLCPTGWHLPSDAEWTILSTNLGGTDVAGGKLKETGTTHWSSPNEGAINLSGFTALPGGYRNPDGPFGGIGSRGKWWSSTKYDYFHPYDRELYYQYSFLDFNFSSINVENGFSVRCIKDN